MAVKKNYHKPPEDPRTIGGGLKAQGRARREKLQLMLDSKPQHTRNDLLPTMELQTIAIKEHQNAEAHGAQARPRSYQGSRQRHPSDGLLG
jgi:hypothetical protein